MKGNLIRRTVVLLLAVAVSTGVTVALPLIPADAGYEFIQPRKAKKAQRKQDKKEREKKQAIKNGSKETRKRSFEIQSPDVQERMKQNKKNIAARDKANRKSSKARTKKGAKKYR